MEYAAGRSIGELIGERNIVLEGADVVTEKGFTMLPNFLLKSRKLSAGDKMAFAMLLSYAWQNDFCFPGQARLALDMGLDERSVRRHLKSLEASELLTISRRGLGKTNIYKLNLKPRPL
jgi:DNA-binding MarR family transcriptional regulator